MRFVSLFLKFCMIINLQCKENHSIKKVADVIATTIATTDYLSDLYYNTHNDISTVKNHLDKVISLINEYHEEDKEKSVLDVGCGPGRDLKYFLNNDISAIGIDLSETTLNIAKKNVPLASLFLMDMSKLEFESGRFNAIWSCGSFYHIPKCLALETLNNFHRVLKSRGIFFLSVKEGEGEQYVNKPEYLNLPKFYSFYLVPELTKMLQDANFKILDCILEYKRDTWINIYAIKE